MSALEESYQETMKLSPRERYTKTLNVIKDFLDSWQNEELSQDDWKTILSLTHSMEDVAFAMVSFHSVAPHSEARELEKIIDEFYDSPESEGFRLFL